MFVLMNLYLPNYFLFSTLNYKIISIFVNYLISFLTLTLIRQQVNWEFLSSFCQEQAHTSIAHSLTDKQEASAYATSCISQNFRGGPLAGFWQ